MSSPQRHGTETSKREYSGQEVWQPLLEWLNAPVKDRTRQRIKRILDLFDYLRTGWEISRASSPSHETLHLRYTRKSNTNEIRELQRMLRKYQYYPLFLPFGSFTSNHWFPAPKGNKYAHGWATEYDDANAVFDMAQLADADLLIRLRKCPCSRWIFARFRHQRFCSVKCREKEFRSSPEWKEYRRKKAREYYQLHKSGKVK